MAFAYEKLKNRTVKNKVNKPKVKVENLPSVHVPLKEMEKNNGGGFTHTVSQSVQFERFLILGTDSNSYYQSAETMTASAIGVAKKMLEEAPYEALKMIHKVSKEGLAVKNSPAILSLALACSYQNKDMYIQNKVRYAAYELIPEVCRTGTHLFEFMQYLVGD